MNDSPRLSLSNVLMFEGGLGLFAAAVGWLISCPPWQTIGSLGWPWSLAWGIVATGPMLLALWGIEKVPSGPLARLRGFVERSITPLFRRMSIWQLAAISVAAGVGEELLFRGLLQAAPEAWMPAPWGAIVGLVVASVLFGLAHYITPTYLFLAGAIGLYLGGLFWLTGDLLAPITAHGLYDFVALLWMIRQNKRNCPLNPEQG